MKAFFTNTFQRVLSSEVFYFLVIPCIVLVSGILLYSAIMYPGINHFTYKNHQYIHFGNRGVVHDPDCKHCFEIYD